MMKKFVMAMMAAVMMTANAAAQSEEQVQAPQQPELNKTEMIKQRTEQMVKEYELTAEQAEKLLALNTEFADKMPMMMPGMRNGQRPQGGEMRRPMRERRVENAEGRPQMTDSMRQARQLRPQGGRPGFDREEMRKVMEDYTAGLKTIFTEDQFKKYEETMNSRRQHMRRGPRGMRPQRPMTQPAE